MSCNSYSINSNNNNSINSNNSYSINSYNSYSINSDNSYSIHRIAIIPRGAGQRAVWRRLSPPRSRWRRAAGGEAPLLYIYIYIYICICICICICVCIYIYIYIHTHTANTNDLRPTHNHIVAPTRGRAAPLVSGSPVRDPLFMSLFYRGHEAYVCSIYIYIYIY